MFNRIAFIDSHIANRPSLITQLPENTEAVLLDCERDVSSINSKALH